jgi:glycosyltransferase involved in cell wall biosynthesis
MPAISVIIATYNCAPFLRESLDSVLGQGWHDREVIVVDDGSTDDTAAVLADYAGRVEVVAAGHAGLAAARNRGLARARGRWIAFQDADDVALTDRLAFQHGFLTAHPEFDAVFCDGERMERAGARVVPPAIARRVAGRALTAADLFAGYPVYFQGALVPRRAFAEAGPFDPAFRVQPDIEYGYRLFARCRATFVDRVVFRYRWHTTNNSRDRLRGREDIARILDRLQREDGDAVRLIGRRRLRAQLARHCYRIARQRLARGEAEDGRAALRRALALRPLHPRYQLLRLWHAF